jgi:ligand-binding sensor domain-containing protein
MEFDKEDNSLSKLSKVQGLSDIGVSSIGFDETSRTLIIGYSNGNIDLMTNNTIVGMTDIKRSPITARKSINSITLHNGLAYLSCGFGIVVLDFERTEIRDTYIIGDGGDFLEVLDLVIFKDSIIAATNRGLRKASLSDPNISYYESWQIDQDIPYPNARYNLIAAHNNDLVVNLPINQFQADTVYIRRDGNWSIFEDPVQQDVTSIESFNGETLSVCINYGANFYGPDYELLERVYTYGEGTQCRPRDIVIDNNGVRWLADDGSSMISTLKEGEYTIYGLQGPQSAKVQRVKAYNGDMWIAAGVAVNYRNTWSNDGLYYISENYSWTNISKSDYPELQDVHDMISLAIDPTNSQKAYFASLGAGLIEVEGNNVMNIYNHENSGLNDALVLEGWVGVTGLDFDAFGNLWIANSSNTNPVAVMTQSGDWYSYQVPGFSEDATGDLVVDDYGRAWIFLPRGGKGVLVYDANGTFDNDTDDRYRLLNTQNGSGGLHSNELYSIAKDLQGNIWIGTDDGPAVFYDPSGIMDPENGQEAQRVIVETGEELKYLLDGVKVTAIAIDGADQKWLGTEGSGLFLMSADGTEELHHFTSENSPLFSDNIITVGVNHLNGEVMIGTDEGLLSFKGYATGEDVFEEEVYAYPNPVPADYSGLIGIKGLPSNSDVRVTDAAGNLVFSTTSEGTQAIWNAQDMSGNRVATGVYFVFGIDSEGNSSQVAKILVLN